MRVNRNDSASPMNPLRVLLLPGWLDSGPGHWQTLWEQHHGWQRVQQDDWVWPRRGDWMARLEEVLLADDRPAILAAHSLGCHLVAAWAAHSQNRSRVAAALLVAPPDLAHADLPPQVSGWRRPAAGALPFPVTTVLSADDPFCAFDRGLAMAAGWGGQVVEVGAGGHLNAGSGLGDWPAGLALLRELARRAGHPDIALEA
jgi:hypothetical protein